MGVLKCVIWRGIQMQAEFSFLPQRPHYSRDTSSCTAAWGCTTNKRPRHMVRVQASAFVQAEISEVRKDNCAGKDNCAVVEYM